MNPFPVPGRGSKLPSASLFVSFLAILFRLGSFAASAQVTPKRDRAAAEFLTQSLMDLHAQYRAAPPAERAALMVQLRSVTAERQQFLSSLIQTNPGEVLRVAIPERIVHVHVHGTRIGGKLALGSGKSTSSFQVVEAAQLSNTFGAKSTLVILVNFRDDSSQPWAAQTALAFQSLFEHHDRIWLRFSCRPQRREATTWSGILSFWQPAAEVVCIDVRYMYTMSGMTVTKSRAGVSV